MKQSLIGSLAVCVAMLAAFVIFGAFPEPVAAQGDGGQGVLYEEGVQLPNDPDWKPEGPVPRMPDGKPDFSGVWWQGSDFNFAGPRRARGPARERWWDLLTPAAAAKAATMSDKDDPSLYCIPEIDGPQNSDIFQLVQTSKWVVYLQETFHGFRLIPLDGRPHGTESPPTFRGDSTARWDGDTLVIDVTNFNTRNWVFYGVSGPPSFHSADLHVVERYTRTHFNTLEVEKTYTDPTVLTRPFVKPKKVFNLAPFDQIMELVCTINETGALMDAAAKLGQSQ